MRASLLTVAVLVLALVAAPAAQKILKQSMSFENKTRNYYLFVPEAASTDPMPLVVLLHGSGRDGTSLAGPWQNLAKKSGFAIVAPDAIERAGWDMFSDGPDFLYKVIEAVKGQTRIDPRRVYLFGHSAGGHHGLAVGLLESEYFAAVALAGLRRSAHTGCAGAQLAARVDSPRLPRRSHRDEGSHPRLLRASG